MKYVLHILQAYAIKYVDYIKNNIKDKRLALFSIPRFAPKNNAALNSLVLTLNKACS